FGIGRGERWREQPGQIVDELAACLEHRRRRTRAHELRIAGGRRLPSANVRRPRRKTLFVVAACLTGVVVLLVGVATALAAWLGAFSSDSEVPDEGLGDAGQPLGDLGPHTAAFERALEARDAVAIDAWPIRAVR